MLALHCYMDWFSIKKKLMIVHKTKSTAFGFSPAFPSCKSKDQLIWILLVNIRRKPGFDRDIWNPGRPRNLQTGEHPVVLHPNSSLMEGSQLYQWHPVIQLNAIPPIQKRVSVSQPCVMRCVLNFSSVIAAVTNHLLTNKENRNSHFLEDCQFLLNTSKMLSRAKLLQAWMNIRGQYWPGVSLFHALHVPSIYKSSSPLLNDKAPLAPYLSNWCTRHPFLIWPNQL